MQEKVIGIVLKTLNYQENRKIITVFSKEKGMISIVVPQASRRFDLCSTFSEVELILRGTRSELFKFEDGSVIDAHLELRSSLESLKTAGELGRLILKSQLPGKAAPKLYLLFSLCLKKIPLYGSKLLSLFVVKLAAHEGVVDWSDASSSNIPCSPKEWSLLQTLASCRSLAELSTVTVDDALKEKVLNCIM